jgi:DNA-binding phage protein
MSAMRDDRMLGTRAVDAAEFASRAIAKYLNDALSTGDPVLIAIGNLVRASLEEAAAAFKRF